MAGGEGGEGFVKQELCRFHKRFWKIFETLNEMSLPGMQRRAKSDEPKRSSSFFDFKANLILQKKNVIQRLDEGDGECQSGIKSYRQARFYRLNFFC